MENERPSFVDALPGSGFTAPPDRRLDLVRSVLEDLPVLSALMDASGRLEFANRPLLEYLGKPFEELKDWGNAGLIHPDDLPGVLDAWSLALRSGKPLDIEYRNRRADGVYRWFQTRGSPIRDAEGRIVLWHIVPLDIDDRKRAESELAGEKRLLEMIASGRPLADVLDALCLFFEAAATECLCGIYPIDWSGPTFQNAVAPSLPASYIAPMEGLPVRLDVAPCGVAAQTRAQVIVEDIESDSRWRDSSYRAHVLAHALRSVWSTPVSSLDGRVLGTFCIYRRTPATPSPHQQELIAQVTHIASIAIDRERKEAELRRSEAFLAQAQRLTLTGSLWWKTLTGEITWSEESYRLLEYPVTVTPTVELILRRCHPEDLPLVQEKVASAIRDGVNMDIEHRLLMPNGAVKHVRVVLQNVGFDSGAPEFVGAVTDITEWKLAQEQLRQSETYLADAQKLSLTGSVGWSVADDRHFWSDETYRIFGYHPSTSVTFPMILQRVHPEDLELVRQALAEAQDGRDFDYEYRLLMPDGSVKHIHLVAHGMRDRNGQLEYIGAVQDVTQQRRSEEALSRLRSELAHVSRVTSLGTLTASITHEVSQPLSGIITNASTCLRMLASEPPNVDGARETARRTIRVGRDHAIARALRQKDPRDRARGPERSDQRGDGAVAERAAARPDDDPYGTGRGPSARDGRSRPTAAGHHEPGPKRVGGDERRRRSATGNRDQDGARRGRSSRVERAGRGIWVRAAQRREAVRRVLYDEAARHGHRVVRQPIDHREPSWPSVGSAQRWPRRHVLVLDPSPARGGEHRSPWTWRFLNAARHA
jgi:PAS domain S-box-containing protein